MDSTIVAVDFGGTQTRAALTDAEGHIIRRVRRPTPAQQGLSAVLSQLKEAIREVREEVEWTQVMGIGLAAPGPLDPWRGVIYEPPNLPGWRDVPLKEIMEQEFGVPVHVGNDANLAALGEHRFGAGRGVNDLIYITVSTGIGGGIISGGELLLGWHGLAAEVGHMSLEPHGPRCGCGGIGCLEALASGPSIARFAVEQIRGGAQTRLLALAGGKPERVTARLVAQAAEEGDPLAIEVLRRAGFYLGLGVTNLLHLFNPQLVIIGGGVSNAGELIFGPLRATVEERAMEAIRQGVRIIPASLGDDVGLLGAVALVLLRT